ncbi:SART-1 family-domain-containing protein [Entophlyctis helioformis]|nr:SART-1 family-domain-containing protein [Entophlyctis helioformis]
MRDKDRGRETADDQDGGGEEVSLSIDETNRLRLSLGLPPLRVGGTTQEQTAEANYEKHRAEEAKKRDRKQLLETIQKEKEAALRNKKLAGKGLGDASDQDDADDSPLAWVQRMKSKELASKARKRDKAAARSKPKDTAGNTDYDASDLAGLRVGHALDDVAQSGEAILVLKDTTIAENEEEGDELVSVSLAEHERTQKNIQNKKKPRKYQGYGDDDDSHGGKRNILYQYDEDDEKSGFTLGQQGKVDVESINAEKRNVSEAMRANAVSLSYEKNREMVDYYTKDELVAFKKPKKTKKKDTKGKRSTARKQLHYGDDEDEAESGQGVDGADAMDVEDDHQSNAATFANSHAKANVDDVNFVDDNDLQQALARSRRRATNARLVADAQELAERMRDLASKVDQALEADSSNQGGLVISDTTEFVRALEAVSTSASSKTTANHIGEASGNTTNRTGAKAVGGWRAAAADGDRTDTADRDVAMPFEGSVWLDGGREEGEVDNIVDDTEGDAAGDEEGQGPIEAEPLVSMGMAATMALLSKKGLVHHMTEEERRRDEQMQQRQNWLAEKKRADALRAAELDRERRRRQETGAGGSSSKGRSRGMHDEEEERERERAEMQAERIRVRELEERFKNYVPQVDLKYHDEYGRELSTKEAWVQLTHRFHGIHSGKNKTEKKLRKIEEEQRFKQMSSADTPLGMASALSERTRTMGQAHVTLSVGNRSAAPLAAVLAIDASGKKSSGTGSGKGKGKSGKDTKDTKTHHDPSTAGSDAIAASTIVFAAPVASVATTGIAPLSTAAATASTATGTALAAGSSNDGRATLPSQGRTRVAFGLNVGGTAGTGLAAKRKAAADTTTAKKPKFE